MNCKRCGTILPNEAERCTACGMKVERTENAEVSTGEPQPRKSQFTWLSCFLLIVIALLIIPPFFIPGNLRARDRAKYTRCVESLTAIKLAEEMYFEDNKEFTDDWDRLSPYMISGCTAKDGSDCQGEVFSRMSNNCADPTLELVGGQFDYKAKGTAFDRLECQICVTPAGYFPEKYDPTDCAAETCP